MNQQPNRPQKIIQVCGIVIAVIIGVGLAFYALAGLFFLIVHFENAGQPVLYETYSLEDYGNYPGLAEEYMTNYISRFFPEQLSDDFKNVRYVFRRSNVDNYSFEAYLEFTFDSADAFLRHIQTATDGMIQDTFMFDSSFQEYVVYDIDSDFVYDHLRLGKKHVEEDVQSYSIEYAKIAKILVNYEEQRVIYIALALHDGGGTRTSFLRSFFERFNIDPKEYELYTETIENRHPLSVPNP